MSAPMSGPGFPAAPVEVGKIDPDPFPGYEYAGTAKDADFPRHAPSSEGYPLSEGHVRNPPESGLKDSGQRIQTATGAIRERLAGKGRYDLISPVVEERLAKHMEAGAIKYTKPGDTEDGGRNWEKGMPLSWYVDGMKRHLGQFLRGETDEDHLAAVLWNAHCLLHTEEMIRRGAAGHTPELNDLPGTRGAYDAAPEYPEPEYPEPESTPEETFVRGSSIPAPVTHTHDSGRACVMVSRARNAWEVLYPGRAPDDLVPVGVPCQIPHPTA